MPSRRRSTASRKPAPQARETASRSIWSGSISFGLLQIPISLHSAEQRSDEIRLRLLDRQKLTPIRNMRVNADTGQPLEWSDIVKGYEYEPGSFVALDDEDLKRANVQASQTIDIQDFVRIAEIDPAYFETPYYAVPSKRSAKAYALLRDALNSKQAAAIGTFVLRTREHLCALLVSGDAIMIETLRFSHQLREAQDLPLPGEAAGGVRFSRKEMDMAERLIDEMMSPWEPSRYKDRYHDDVLKMIERKLKTGKVRAAHTRARGEVASNVVDLVAILKKSVDRHGKAGSRPHAREAA